MSVKRGLQFKEMRREISYLRKEGIKYTDLWEMNLMGNMKGGKLST